MPLTGEMLNAQGNATCKKEAPTISPEYVSLGLTNKEVTPESAAATKTRKIKRTAHGLVTKDLVVLSELNGKTGLGEEEGGLVVGAPYWVREISSSEFSIAYTKAQAETSEAECIEWTAEVKTTTKFLKIIEATVKERVKVTWAAAANLLNEDATAREVESTAAGQKVTYLLYYSAASAGTLTLVEKAEEEKTLASGDLYKVKTSKLAQTGYRT